MKRLSLSVLVFFLFACGRKNPNTSVVNALGDGNAPMVSIPANAFISDYTCTEIREFRTPSGQEQSERSYSGVIHFWKDSGFSVSFDENSDGLSKELSRYQKYTLDGGRFRLQAENIHWQSQNGSWKKVTDQVERVTQKQGNRYITVSNKLNGVDSPFEWSMETNQIDSKIIQRISRHTNPSSLDHDGLQFTKIETSCLETSRQ